MMATSKYSEIKDLNGKTILDEDVYIDKMSQIIERDYFPEIIRYRKLIVKEKPNQSSYTGLSSRDSTNLHFNTLKSEFTNLLTDNTGSTSHHISSEPPTAQRLHHNFPTGLTMIGVPESFVGDTARVIKGPRTQNYTLTSFLDKFTSEDDASFAEIVVKNKIERVKKYPWLHLEDKKAEDFAIGQESTYVQTWDYKNRNALMNVPGYVAPTSQNVPIAQLGTDINYGTVQLANTRYNVEPGSDPSGMGGNEIGMSRKTLAQVLTQKFNARQSGKIGPDGKELLSTSAIAAKPILEGRTNPDLNQMDGFPTYKLIPTTPIIDPAGGETPLMTWGEIEGTPLRQEFGGTPMCRTQGFHMPNITNKEKLAIKLTAGVVRRNKEEKMKGAAHRKRILTPGATNEGFMTPDLTDRISCLSPAAHRLATRRLRINTNSSGISSIFKRPLTKTKGSRKSSSKSSVSTHVASRRLTTQEVVADETSHECRKNYENLTDDLLKLPKI